MAISIFCYLSFTLFVRAYMYVAILGVFILGYILIATEHSINVNKAATALLTGTICWVLFILGGESYIAAEPGPDFLHQVVEELREHLGEISEILFFLLGAMTIVEIIDAHEGFAVITNSIKTTKRRQLLWILAFVTFFLSSVLDNLTTAIVMAALLKKLLQDREDIWVFAGMLVIAANAGGAWSPIGDVTTIMLWIGGQITAFNIIQEVFLPSMVCLLVPLLILSLRLKGEISRPAERMEGKETLQIPTADKNLVFFAGIGVLLFVPVFKTITHLPPFMGILFGLGVIWVLTEILHRNKPRQERKALSIAGVLQRIDTPSVLFFLGILLAVAALQAAGHLTDLAHLLDKNFNDIYLVNTIVGTASAIVDNVPLVAGAMGMYPMTVYPPDHAFWELLAYCAGTGGSMLIIGSAAGVAIMGILKIDFFWYLKKISFPALCGYLAGVLTYVILH